MKEELQLKILQMCAKCKNKETNKKTNSSNVMKLLNLDMLVAKKKLNEEESLKIFFSSEFLLNDF